MKLVCFSLPVTVFKWMVKISYFQLIRTFLMLIKKIILDACRDNPLTRSLKPGFGSRGLASVNAPAGSLIAYATAPGKTAADNQNGNNGLYTGELIKNINNRGITIEEMFRKVRRSVMDSSDDRQVPWESTSLTGEYYFNP